MQVKQIYTLVNDVTKEYESMLNNLKNRDEQIKSLKEEVYEFILDITGTDIG